MNKSLPPLLMLGLLCVAAVSFAADQPAPRTLPHAHAHNDYQHPRPLLDALDHGFTNIEADVFLVGDKLLVAHDLIDIRPARTLQALYLDPLFKRFNDGPNRIHADGRPLTLLIDFKNDGPAAYRALHAALKPYEPMLTVTRDGKTTKGQVTIVISGNRPKALIAELQPRYAGIDGRMTDLASTDAADLMPWLSDNWTKHFKWRGHGAMPDEEKARLKKMVEQAQAKGRRVRFWATPESPAVWKELLEAKVDIIGTDKLADLRDFLLAQPSTAP